MIFKYDVFLSHSRKDKAVVRDLAERLRGDGLQVWLTEWEIKPRERAAAKQQKLERGLEQSRVMVLCVSVNAVTVGWGTLEHQTTRFRDPVDAYRRFIPLRLDDAEPKEKLGAVKWLDWRSKSPEQYALLLSACRRVDGQLHAKSLAAQTNRESSISLDLTDDVLSIAFSGDGQLAITGSATHRMPENLFSGGDGNLSISWPDKHTMRVSRAGSDGYQDLPLPVIQNKKARVWDVTSGRCLTVLDSHEDVWGVALSMDGRLALSGDGTTLHCWDVTSGSCHASLEGHTQRILSAAFSGDGQRAVSGADDMSVRVWDLASGRCLAVFTGHTRHVWGVALNAAGNLALSGSSDHTLRVWDVTTERCIAILEGHTDHVNHIALSDDGRRALSQSCDGTLRAWDVTDGQCLAVLTEDTIRVRGVAFIDDVASVFSWKTNGKVSLWSLLPLDESTLPEAALAKRYTNAKVVLLGNTGVGKSGLALRLCEGRWEATESTHGMIVSQLNLAPEADSSDVEHEIWLWDFAGQPDYRLIHQLYMEETALCVLVFDPQDDNSLDALRYWETAMGRVARVKGMTPAKLLVAARCDRGGITVSKRRFSKFCQAHGYAGLWITGAKTGDGCDDLKAAIAENISWERLPWVTTTTLFKSLKDALLRLKDEDTPLVRLPELRQRLQLMLPTETITADTLRTVVGLVEGQGVLKTLDFGDFVLLQVEQINRYASVVVRMAREHEGEMGVVPEQPVLDGRLDYKGMSRLSESDEKILLRAMLQTFLDRALCLRETTPAGIMLVFPSYFRRDRPEASDYPNVFVTYGFAGPPDEIYATLVVKLSYSNEFRKDQLWKDAADFKTPGGKRVGLSLRKKVEGTAELDTYFEPGVPDDTKVMFIRYIHEHLRERAQDVTRVRTYICPQCHIPLESRKAIEIRLESGCKDIVCSVCEERVILVDLIEEKFASDEFVRRVLEMDELARFNLDNESRELILVGHTYAIAGEAGQIFRQYTNSDHGIDGEIEFKDLEGKASGKRLYLQLKSGDSYLRLRKRDGAEIFTIKNGRWVEYWQKQGYPVMLVIRTSDKVIRWMNVTEYLKHRGVGGKQVKQIVFEGQPFTASDLRKIRSRLLSPAP